VRRNCQRQKYRKSEGGGVIKAASFAFFVFGRFFVIAFGKFVLLCYNTFKKLIGSEEMTWQMGRIIILVATLVAIFGPFLYIIWLVKR